MAIESYNKIYLDDVSENIGTMFQYAVYYGYDPIMFWNMFCSSTLSYEIEHGNPKYMVGHSAIDLLNFVVDNNDFIMIDDIYDKDRFYWAGWALARYQNYKLKSFREINKLIPIERVLALYNTLHEADISKFFNVLDEFYDKNKTETKLKKYRTLLGLSQSELARKAEVSIRNIQMYEQRQNDINKAQGDILLRLSKILHCNIEDLFE